MRQYSSILDIKNDALLGLKVSNFCTRNYFSPGLVNEKPAASDEERCWQTSFLFVSFGLSYLFALDALDSI